MIMFRVLGVWSAIRKLLINGLRGEAPESLSRMPTKVNSLRLNPRLLIALHSPSALCETGLRMCPSEKSQDGARLRC
jgi:hypothetical protein